MEEGHFHLHIEFQADLNYKRPQKKIYKNNKRQQADKGCMSIRKGKLNFESCLCLLNNWEEKWEYYRKISLPENK